MNILKQLMSSYTSVSYTHLFLPSNQYALMISECTTMITIESRTWITILHSMSKSKVLSKYKFIVNFCTSLCNYFSVPYEDLISDTSFYLMIMIKHHE